MHSCTLILIVLLSFVTLIHSVVVTYDWELTWVNANPDGRLVRPVIGVNGRFPCPTINVNVGDQLVVKVTNSLGNESTSIHWHGMHQEGTNAMDGPTGAVQCPIPPGSSFTYDFTVNQTGTYWWHSHHGGQMPDGLRGPLIVHDPGSPYAHQYDDELVLTFSDWYHDQMPGLINHYLSPEQNPNGAEPEPYSAVLNDVQDARLSVEPGKTYLVRIISMAAFAQAFIWFDQHKMTIVEVDGVYTKPQEVDSIYLATAQRYSVLLKTKGDASANYAITASMDTSGFDSTPDYVVQNVTAALMYNKLKAPPAPVAPVAEIKLFDDFNLAPYDERPLLSGTPDVSFTLDLNFFQQDDQNRAGFNNITYIAQAVPTLATVLTTGKAASNASIYGANTNAMVAGYGQLVEVVVNNYDTGAHVMHIHGHAPQLVARVSGEVDHNRTITVQAVYSGDSSSFPPTPIRRDSWVLAAAGYTVIRFIADNPGVWIIHCHMEWHVDAGLTATIIEAPTQLQAQTFPPAMAQICKDQHVTTQGNAVGNVDDPYDLDGQVTVCPPHPNGAVYGGIGSGAGSSSGGIQSVGSSNTDTKKPDEATRLPATATHLPATATRLPGIATPLPKVAARHHVWQ